MGMKFDKKSLYNYGMSQDRAISAEDNKYAYKNRNIRIISPTDNIMQIVTNYKGGKRLTKTANIQVPANSILMNIDLSIYKNGKDTGTVVNTNCIIPDAEDVSTSINLPMMMQRQIPMYFTCKTMRVNESSDYGKVPGFNTKYYVLSVGGKLTISNNSKYANSTINGSYNAENDMYVYSGAGAKFIIKNLYVNREVTPKTLINANVITGTLLTSCITPDYLVVFAKDGNTDKIYRITLNELVKGDYTLNTLYSGTELNFHTDRHYDTVYYEENANVKKIYWCEGWKEGKTDNNKLRFINLVTEGERYGGTTFTPYTENKFEFYPLIGKAPRVKIQKLYNQDSDLPAGVIQYFITYYNENGAETKICQDTSLITLHPKDRGSKEDEKGNCVVQISISEYSTDFDYIRIYSAARSTLNGSISARIVADLKIPDSGGELSFIDNYKAQEAIQDTQLFFIGGTALCANTIDEKQGTLFAGNVYTEQITMPQDIKDLFNPETSEYITNITNKDGVVLHQWSKLVKFTRKNQRYVKNLIKDDTHSLLWWDEELTDAFSQDANNINYYVDNQLDSVLKGLITDSDASKKARTAYKQTDYSQNADDIYAYQLSSNFAKSNYLGYKFGEIYRFGLQFQNVNGEWTEVVYIGDGECRCSPEVDTATKSILYTNAIVKLPKELQDKCVEYKYTNYRLVIADPETSNGRKIVAQGILCPTVFSPLNRYMKTSWAEPSWIFRPLNGDAPYNHLQRMASYWYRTSEIANTKGDESIFQGPTTETTTTTTKPDATQNKTSDVLNKVNVLITLFTPHKEGKRKNTPITMINFTIDKKYWYGDKDTKAGLVDVDSNTPIDNFKVVQKNNETTNIFGSAGDVFFECLTEMQKDNNHVPALDGSFNLSGLDGDQIYDTAYAILKSSGYNDMVRVTSITESISEHAGICTKNYHEKMFNYYYLFSDNDKAYLTQAASVSHSVIQQMGARQFALLLCYKKDISNSIKTDKLTTSGNGYTNDAYSYKGLQFVFEKYKNKYKKELVLNFGSCLYMNITVSPFSSEEIKTELPETKQIESYMTHDSYFIDNSLVTFNTPEIDSMVSIDGNSMTLDVIGAAYINGSYGKRTIELSGIGRRSSAEIQMYNEDTYIGKNVTKTYLSDYCIEDSFLTRVLDGENKTHVILRDDSTTFFMTHMWEMPGSITGVTQNNNIESLINLYKLYEPVDKDHPLPSDYAVIKYNKTYNYKFAEQTKYIIGNVENSFQTGQVTVTGEANTANQINTKFFGTHIYNTEINKALYKKSNIKYVTNTVSNKYLTSEYIYGKNDNKEEIVGPTVTKWKKGADQIEADTDVTKLKVSNAFKENNVRITYKETPHAVFSLGGNNSNIQALPVASNEEIFNNNVWYCGGDNDHLYNEQKSLIENECPWAKANGFKYDYGNNAKSFSDINRLYLFYAYTSNGKQLVADDDIVSYINSCTKVPVNDNSTKPTEWNIVDENTSSTFLSCYKNRHTSVFLNVFNTQWSIYVAYTLCNLDGKGNPKYDDKTVIKEEDGCNVYKAIISKTSRLFFLYIFYTLQLKLSGISTDDNNVSYINVPSAKYSHFDVAVYISNIYVYVDKNTQKVKYYKCDFDCNKNTLLKYNNSYCNIKSDVVSLVDTHLENLKLRGTTVTRTVQRSGAAKIPGIDLPDNNTELVVNNPNTRIDPEKPWIWVEPDEPDVEFDEFYKFNTDNDDFNNNLKIYSINTKLIVPKNVYNNPHYKQKVLHSSIVSNRPLFMIGDLKRNLEHKDLYGGFSEQALQKLTWLPASKYTAIDDIVYQSWGDTYFQRYDCLKTYPRSEEDMNQVTDIASVMIETHQNLDTRTDVNRWNFNTMARPDNFGLYNPVYNQKDNLFTGSVLPELLNFRAYNNMIVWSNTKNIAGTIDSWTNLSLNSYAKTREAVTKIINYNENLFVFEPNYIERIIYKDTNLVNTNSANSPIRVDFSDKVVVLPWLENYGSNNPNVLITQAGLYYVDDERRTVYRIGMSSNQLAPTPIGKDLIQGFFNENITKYSGNRKFSSDIRFYYDVLNKDVFIMLGDKHCIVYNETLETCVSFLDCNTELMGMFTKSNKTYAFRNGTRSTWDNASIYEMYTGKYNQFFDTYLPYEIEYRVNTSPSDTLFTNIEFLADLGTFKDNSTKNDDIPFKTIQVYNEYQDTGTVTLTYDRYKSSNLKQKFRTWRAVIPRSKTGSGRDRIRNPWIHLILKNDPQKDVRLDLHSMIVDCYV